MAKQLAHRQFEQFLARVTEQLAGGNIQVAQSIGKRIEQRDGFGAMLKHHVPRRIGQIGPAVERVCFGHGYEVS
ncbi:hypothetical protein D3C76_921730 [compost metagenome]